MNYKNCTGKLIVQILKLCRLKRGRHVIRMEERTPLRVTMGCSMEKSVVGRSRQKGLDNIGRDYWNLELKEARRKMVIAVFN